MEKIKEKMRRKLSVLKIVSYYGCVLTRPPGICQFDNFENPQSMDTIVGALVFQ